MVAILDNNDQGTAGTSVPCVQTDTSIMTETKESVWAQIHATKASTSAIQDQDRIQDKENEGDTKEGSKFKGKDNREETELDTRERPCCVVTKIPEEKRPDKPTFVMSNAVSRCKYSSLEVSVAWRPGNERYGIKPVSRFKEPQRYTHQRGTTGKTCGHIK